MKQRRLSREGTSWSCAGSEGADCSRAARRRRPPPPVPADRTQTLAAGTSAAAQKPAAKTRRRNQTENQHRHSALLFLKLWPLPVPRRDSNDNKSVPSLRYLIRLHRRVLDHHALHLVAHIALLVASESEVGGWLHAHDGLVAGRRVRHHGLVH